MVRVSWLIIGAGLALAVFLVLHESHYRKRDDRIERARTAAAALGGSEGFELRLRAVESILTEDRAT
jgi:spore coat polysaccharide biosynthesis predicted glycosyltransferase SpsG